MPILKKHIDRYNSKILNKSATNKADARCNCLASWRDECPIPGRCTAPSKSKMAARWP